VSAVTSKQRKRTYNTLQQNHLPRLEEAGFIGYDRNRGTITLETEPRRIKLFLNLLPKSRSSWVWVFLTSGVLLWLVLATNWTLVHVIHLYTPTTGALISGFALLFVFLGFLQIYRLL
jgi:hypothetical protein